MWRYIPYSEAVGWTWNTYLLTVGLAMVIVANRRLDKRDRITRHPIMVVLSFFNLLLMIACAVYWYTVPG